MNELYPQLSIFRIYHGSTTGIRNSYTKSYTLIFDWTTLNQDFVMGHGRIKPLCKVLIIKILNVVSTGLCGGQSTCEYFIPHASWTNLRPIYIESSCNIPMASGREFFQKNREKYSDLLKRAVINGKKRYIKAKNCFYSFVKLKVNICYNHLYSYTQPEPS